MHILLVSSQDITHFSAYFYHLQGVANAFHEKGHSVSVLCPKTRDTLNIGPYIKVPIDYYAIPRFFQWTRFFNPIFAVLSFRKQLRKPLDMVYIRMSPLSFILNWMSYRRHIRTISEHNGLLGDEIKLLYPSFAPIAMMFDYFQRLNIRYSHAVRAVSENLRASLCKKTDHPHIVHITNGTDTNHFKPMKRSEALQRFDLDTERNYVGFIGTLIKTQGLEFAIRSFSEFWKKHPKVHLLIAGFGPELDALQELSRQLGIDDHVTFMGHIKYEDAPIVINCFDIAISPAIRQRNETVGLATMKVRDYLACGRLVVASRLPGYEFLEAEKLGILFDPESEDAFVRALEEGLGLSQAEDEEKRLYAITNFSWSHVTDKVLLLCE